MLAPLSRAQAAVKRPNSHPQNT